MFLFCFGNLYTKISHFMHFQIYSSVVLITFPKLCLQHHPLSHFFITQTVFSTDCTFNSPLPYSGWLLVTCILNCDSVNFHILFISCKWNLSIFILSCWFISLKIFSVFINVVEECSRTLFPFMDIWVDVTFENS